MFKKASEETITGWIRTKDLNRLGSYLVSGSVHGKPGVPVAELARVEKILRREFSEAALYQLAKKLLRRPEYTARCIGSHLIACGGFGSKDLPALLRLAANDPDWIVRESAAGGFAGLLARDFRPGCEMFFGWVQAKTRSEEDVNVKRAVALAVKYDSKTADPGKWKSYFRLIDPLMGEEAEYIRKNLGPFAIGDGLLGRYPQEVLAACNEWKLSANEHVRWNTAMIFTAAGARKFSVKGGPVIRLLAKDPVPSVARAAVRAGKNLSKA
jgi:hypothetical protein